MESGGKAEEDSKWVSPGMDSASLSRGEEEMEEMVQVAGRTRVRRVGGIWVVRDRMSVGEVGVSVSVAVVEAEAEDKFEVASHRAA